MEKILPWIGGIFAVVGLLLIFIDSINTIKRHDKTKLNVAGLVILSVAVVGYVITDLILPAAMPEGSGWPPLASFTWIAMFWIYVLLMAITLMGDIKIVRNKSRQQKPLQSRAQAARVDDQQPAEQQKPNEQQQPKQRAKKTKKGASSAQQTAEQQAQSEQQGEQPKPAEQPAEQSTAQQTEQPAEQPKQSERDGKKSKKSTPYPQNGSSTAPAQSRSRKIILPKTDRKSKK